MRRADTLHSPARDCLLGPLVICLLLAVAAHPVAAEAQSPSRSPQALEFRGQVVIPAGSRMRDRRITLTLVHVNSVFSVQTLADSRGRFRFKKIPAGTYTLSILIPSAGEMRSTLDITPSFADANGRVEKVFTYDAEMLAERAVPHQSGIVSVRQLSLPRKARSEYAAARNELRRQRVENAERHLRKAVELAPEFVEARNALGVLAYQRGEYAAAAEHFRRALEYEPDAYEPLLNLGGALLSLHRLEEAVEVNRRVQQMQPKDPLANAQLGLAYYLLGEDEEALNYLLLTVELDPAHYTHPQIPLANIYLRNSQVQSAREELEEFLKYHPDIPEAASVRATLERIRRDPRSETASTTAAD